MAQQISPEGSHDESFSKIMRDIIENLVVDPSESETISGSEVSMAAFGFIKPDDTKDKPSDNKTMEYVPRQELDAKLETIEARMDGRLARIEDRFASIDRQFSDMRSILSDQKNTAWRSAGVTIAAMVATVVAVAALGFSAFDSGRDTAKVAADAQLQTSAALAEIRQIVSDLKQTAPAALPVAPPPATK